MVTGPVEATCLDLSRGATYGATKEVDDDTPVRAASEPR